MTPGPDEWEHFRAMSSPSPTDHDPVSGTTDAEEQLKRALAVLRSALDATVDGILVVDREGNMVSFNRQFAEMWDLSDDVLAARRWERALEASAARVRDPEVFLERTARWTSDPEARGADVVELVDGRVLERFSQPHLMGDEVVGRVWSFRDVTERVRAEAELRSSERRYRSLFKDSRQAIYLTTKDGSFIDANPAMLEMFGYTRDELATLNASELYVDPRARAAFRHAVEDRGAVVKYPVNLRARDGTEMECLLTSTVWTDAAGEIQGYQGIIENVTERNRAERALRENERKFRSLIERASDTITVLDEARSIRYVSPSWRRVLGYEAEDVGGKDFAELVHPDDRPLVVYEFDYLSQSRGASTRLEMRVRHADGSWRVMEIVGTNLLHEASVAGMVLNGRDVTDRKRAEEQLLHDAFHDRLTGLPNRALLLDRLDQILKRVARHPETRFAVLFLDLDRFKVLNDSLGHGAGDEFLTAIAHRIAGALRPADTLARLGGDEFTVLLEDSTGADALLVAERIRSLLEQPFFINGQEIFTTASIGIATSDERYRRPQDILRDADLAMYEAKRAGGNQAVVFDSSMYRQAVTTLRIETDLRRALERDEFELFFQPIVRLDDETLTGFEALIRWRHPGLGLLPPSRFLGVAEETGLIVGIGEWVMRSAGRTLARWREAFPRLAGVSVHINVSVHQLNQPDFVQRARAALSETRAPGEHLCMEITESAMMSNAEASVSTLRGLKSLGISLAIDDFGTGYSSLSYLHRFPTDSVKIDRSFVAAIGTQPRELGLVRTIVDLAHDLGMEAVAEGVETETQAAILGDLGCAYVQGFRYAPALPLPEAEAVLLRGRV